jgi:hypothetical protein
MAFEGTSAFFERSYVIDYVSRSIRIEGYPWKVQAVFDFTVDWLLGKSFPFWGMTTILLLFLKSHGLLSHVWFENLVFFSALFYLVGFIVYDMIYVSYPHSETLRKIQMYLEFPCWMICWHKKKKTIEIMDCKQLTLHMHFYWKYNMLFCGRCKKDIESVRYEVKGFMGKRDLIITFKKPTRGTIMFEYQGFIKSIGVDGWTRNN